MLAAAAAALLALTISLLLLVLLFLSLARAQIVLNLRYFESDNEWKMTRLMRLLANRRFIVSETSGDAAERGRFEAGIVFTDAARIVQVVKYYLARPRERHRIARAGFAIMRALRSADALLEPVRQLVAGMGCVAAKEAEGQL